MAKEKDINNIEEKDSIKKNKKEKKVKTKKSKYQKRKVVMNIMAWFMALLMILGVLATFLSFFIA